MARIDGRSRHAFAGDGEASEPTRPEPDPGVTPTTGITFDRNSLVEEAPEDHAGDLEVKRELSPEFTPLSREQGEEATRQLIADVKARQEGDFGQGHRPIGKASDPTDFGKGGTGEKDEPGVEDLGTVDDVEDMADHKSDPADHVDEVGDVDKQHSHRSGDDLLDDYDKEEPPEMAEEEPAID